MTPLQAATPSIRQRPTSRAAIKAWAGIVSRDVPVVPSKTALLFIDVQNFSCHPQGGEHATMAHHTGTAAHRSAEFDTSGHFEYFFDRLNKIVVPNMQQLQRACRAAKIEVMYTVIESLTQDGRDRSLDCKITGFNVPKGSWDGQVLNDIEPEGDEMVIPKTSSSVFISTNIHYILGNLGVQYLIVCGVLTDQCVSSAVRDACDLGYLVTLVEDACATHSAERHDASIDHIKGYCRRVTTAELCAEIEGMKCV